MKRRFYLDTCIWRDYYENRSDNFRPLGEWALFLINKINDNKEIILYSSFVIDELNKHYDEKKIVNMFEPFQNKGLLIKVDILKYQVVEAKKLSLFRNIPFGDALHAIIARDNKAIFITRDKHALELLDIVIVKKPEDLL
ncbi:PIN domain-containing protein [Candidatus Woesearchaeota archaeon]|nr:PIN domain-containing protein [Candidatus Woesearchaeota archaeon]